MFLIYLHTSLKNILLKFRIIGYVIGLMVVSLSQKDSSLKVLWYALTLNAKISIQESYELSCKLSSGKENSYYKCDKGLGAGEEKCGSVGIRMDILDEILWTLVTDNNFIERDIIRAVEVKADSTEINVLKAQITKKDKELSKAEKERKNHIRLARMGVLEDEDIANDMRQIKTTISDLTNDLLTLRTDLETFDINPTDTLKQLEAAELLKDLHVIQRLRL